MNACKQMHVHLHPPSWNPRTQLDPPREAVCVRNYAACLHETASRCIAMSGVGGNGLSQQSPRCLQEVITNHCSTLNIVAAPSYPNNTPPAPTNYIQLLQYRIMNVKVREASVRKSVLQRDATGSRKSVSICRLISTYNGSDSSTSAHTRFAEPLETRRTSHYPETAGMVLSARKSGLGRPYRAAPTTTAPLEPPTTVASERVTTV